MTQDTARIPGSTIGILSGMGPLAGSDVLQKILAYAAQEYGAVEDAEYPDVVLISHGFDGFDAQGTISHDLEQKLVQVIQQLESVGATHIGVACNTAHACLDAMRQACNLPIANLPEETAKQAAKQPGNYLLITSHAAREAELYPTAMKAAGVDFTELSDEDQKIADEVIGLVMAYRLPEAGQKIAELVAPHLHKVDGVIAGCTELPIAFDFSGNIVKDKLYVDSNQVLAQALADQCYTRAAVAV